MKQTVFTPYNIHEENRENKDNYRNNNIYT